MLQAKSSNWEKRSSLNWLSECFSILERSETQHLRTGLFNWLSFSTYDPWLNLIERRISFAFFSSSFTFFMNSIIVSFDSVRKSTACLLFSSFSHDLFKRIAESEWAQMLRVDSGGRRLIMRSTRERKH